MASLMQPKGKRKFAEDGDSGDEEMNEQQQMSFYDYLDSLPDTPTVLPPQMVFDPIGGKRNTLDEVLANYNSRIKTMPAVSFAEVDAYYKALVAIDKEFESVSSRGRLMCDQFIEGQNSAKKRLAALQKLLARRKQQLEDNPKFNPLTSIEENVQAQYVLANSLSLSDFINWARTNQVFHALAEDENYWASRAVARLNPQMRDVVLSTTVTSARQPFLPFSTIKERYKQLVTGRAQMIWPTDDRTGGDEDVAISLDNYSFHFFSSRPDGFVRIWYVPFFNTFLRRFTMYKEFKSDAKLYKTIKSRASTDNSESYYTVSPNGRYVIEIDNAREEDTPRLLFYDSGKCEFSLQSPNNSFPQLRGVNNIVMTEERQEKGKDGTVKKIGPIMYATVALDDDDIVLPFPPVNVTIENNTLFQFVVLPRTALGTVYAIHPDGDFVVCVLRSQIFNVFYPKSRLNMFFRYVLHHSSYVDFDVEDMSQIQDAKIFAARVRGYVLRFFQSGHGDDNVSEITLPTHAELLELEKDPANKGQIDGIDFILSPPQHPKFQIKPVVKRDRDFDNCNFDCDVKFKTGNYLDERNEIQRGRFLEASDRQRV